MHIPTTIDEACSPEWLSSILGAPVEQVVVGELDIRVSTNVPLRVDTGDGRALDVWIKGYFDEPGSPARYAGVPEVHFYRELADTAGLRTLRCLFAEVDPDTALNVLVTEDVGADATFPDGRVPCTPDQTAQALAELAALHASTWLDERAARASWLDSRLALYTVARGLREVEQNFASAVGSGVPDAVRDPERLLRAYRTLGEEVAAVDPWCVVHGDAHIRNVFLDGGGRPSFIDWQLVQRGPWYLDVGYHLASMLSVEDRRAHQDALVEEYLGRLTATGIPRPPREEVEAGLRRSFVHGFYLWAITLRVDRDCTSAILARLGAAVDDHDAYEELER